MFVIFIGTHLKLSVDFSLIKIFWESKRLAERDVPEPTFHLMTRPYGMKCLEFLIQLAACTQPDMPEFNNLNDYELDLASQLITEKKQACLERIKTTKAEIAKDKAKIREIDAHFVKYGHVDIDQCKINLTNQERKLTESLQTVNLDHFLPIAHFKMVHSEAIEKAEYQMRQVIDQVDELSQTMLDMPPAIVKQRLNEELEIQDQLITKNVEVAQSTEKLNEEIAKYLESAPSKSTLIRQLKNDLKALCLDSQPSSSNQVTKPELKAKRRRPQTSS